MTSPGQKVALPAWIVSLAVALLSGGISSAVTYGATITRVGTIERDVAAVLAREERRDAQVVVAERESAVTRQQIGALTEQMRELRADTRATRDSVARLVAAAEAAPPRRGR